jgi:hypothetical protein
MQKGEGENNSNALLLRLRCLPNVASKNEGFSILSQTKNKYNVEVQLWKTYQKKHVKQSIRRWMEIWQE